MIGTADKAHTYNHGRITKPLSFNGRKTMNKNVEHNKAKLGEKYIDCWLAFAIVSVGL